MIKKWWTETQRQEIDEYLTKKNLPLKVQEEINSIISTLDYYYGIGRDINADGGYVAFADTRAEYEEILKTHHITRECIEFHDELCRTEQGTYYADLYIVSDDTGVTIIWREEKGEQG